MADRREVASLPLKKSHVQALLRSGFRTVHDLKVTRISDLAEEIGVGHAEAKEILEASLPVPPAMPSTPHGTSGMTRPSESVLGRTAQDMYEEVRSRRHIITFCKEIDQMLGGGVHLGEMIEFCGVPGIGKTQLAMQLCVDVQIPEAFHGVGGEAIYIDTEGSFMVERCLQMAAAVQQHLTMICRHHQRQPQLDALANLLGSAADASSSQPGSSQADLSGSASIEGHAFLKGIHVMRVHDHTQQLAAVHALPALLAQNPRVRMIVMDSVAFHFRHGASSVDFAKRARLLSAMSQKLNELANKQALAVVLLNQMTTKVGSGNGSRLVPALGESWAHAATHRVQLYWAPSLNNTSHGSNASDVAGTYASVDRAASLIKSSCRPSDVVARYTVTELGVRDVRRPRRAPPAALPGEDVEDKRARHDTPAP